MSFVPKAPGFVGYGVVGKATSKLFPGAPIFDPFAAEVPNRAASIQEINDRCDAVTVCLPSPWDPTLGRLDTSAIADTVAELTVPLILIRSTLNPGDADRMQKTAPGEVVVWPEYLGETPDHPFASHRPPFVLFGGSPDGRRSAIQLLHRAFNASVRVRQVDRLTAEICKLSENRAIAWRIHECQELYDACEAQGVDFYEVREAVYGDDPRMMLWWSFVYPEARGFDSKCIPKDIHAWVAWARETGIEPSATEAILAANQRYLDARARPAS